MVVGCHCADTEVAMVVMLIVHPVPWWLARSNEDDIYTHIRIGILVELAVRGVAPSV